MKTPNAKRFREAINQKCKECCYDPLDQGTWRAQVERCPAWHCPLYKLRPIPIKKDE